MKKIFTRMNITIFILLTEIAFLSIIIYQATHILPHLTLMSYFISTFLVIYIVKNNEEESSYKISWLIIVMAIPIGGTILYLLFKNQRPSMQMRKRFKKEQEIIKPLLLCYHNQAKILDKRIDGIVQYIQNTSNYPIYQNTRTKYYPFGQFMFDDMLIALKSAEKFIFLEYFTINEGEMWNKILEILVDKAVQGIEVRLTYDSIGSFKLFSRHYRKKLEEKKIKVTTFNPFVPILAVIMNNRNHRKIMIIDGKTAFNGGINISDEYINKTHPLGIWKDTGIKIEGSAIWNLTLMFIEMWNASCKQGERIIKPLLYKYDFSYKNEDGFIQPFGDTPLDKETLGENVYVEILNQAKNYVYVFTPYLIISEKMCFALKMAAKRGVNVSVCLPSIPDNKIVFRISRSYYHELIKAGVKIFEYTPGFVHGKVFVSDDEIAIVGTINLDFRSLYLHFECATLMYKTKTIINIKEDAITTMANSRQIQEQDIKRTFLGKLLDATLRLIAPML